MNKLISDKIKKVLYSKTLSLADRVKLLFLDNPYSQICCHTVGDLFYEYEDIKHRDLGVVASGVLSELWKSKFMYLRRMDSCHHSVRQHFMYYFKYHPDIIREGEFHELNTRK